MTRDGAIGEADILRFFYTILHRCHPVGRDMVEIHNHVGHKAGDVLSRASSLHHCLWHNRRALLLEGGELRFQVFHTLFVVSVLRLFIERERRLIVAA